MRASFWFMAWALTAGLLLVVVGVTVWLHTRHEAAMNEIDEAIAKMRGIIEEKEDEIS